MVLTILPIVGITIFNYAYSSSEFERLMEVEAKAIVHKMNYEMTNFYGNAFSNLQRISSLEVLQSAITEKPSAQKQVEIELLLSNLLQMNTIFESYQIVNLSGKQIYKEYLDSTVAKVYLQDIRDRSYFSEPLKSGNPYISDVILARATNKLIIIVGNPIKDSTGEIVGLISGVIGFNNISRLTNQLHTSPKAYPFITSPEGLFLSHANDSLIGKENLFEVCEMTYADQQKIRSEESGILTYKYMGEEKLLYFQSDIDDKYIIFYTIPMSDYFSSIYKLRLVAGITAICVSLLALILALFLSNKIESAMRSVQEAHNEVEYKNLELKSLASKLAKYLSPQLYRSIFSGERDVKIETYRKKLTVFFSDIKDFAQITDSMQSEELSILLNEYLNEMSKIAVRYGGTIDKYIGDAMMIFFGDPDTQGDKEDAMACVSMAIEMRRTMRSLHTKWVERGISRPLKIRIGINTGYCTIGNFGSEERLDYTIIGGEVNLASRLESKSDVDKILISHETFALIKDRIYCQYVGELKVKGFAYEVKTYEVVDFIDELSNRGVIDISSYGFNLQIDITKVFDHDQMIQNLLETIATLNSEKEIMNKCEEFLS